MLDKNLLFKAAEADLAQVGAQAAIEEAKRLVEEAKAGVEAAKAGLAEAKAHYEIAISDIVATGISASKAKKAVADINRVFADVGIIDAPSDDAPAEPKAPRRKKSESIPAPAEAGAAVETVPSQGEAGVIQTTTEVPTATPASVEDTAVVQEAVATSEEVAVVEEAAVQQASAEAEKIDNGDVIGEIYEIIESATEGEDITVSETLITLLNAADWYSRDHLQVPLSIDLYREILNVDFVNQAVAPVEDKELKVALEAIRGSDSAKNIFDWFLHVLDKLESGVGHLSYIEYLAKNAEAPAVSDHTSSEAESLEVVEEEIAVDAADYTQDPETEEEPSDEVSDDVTLAADDGLVGVEVEDIEGINFLDEAAGAAEVPAEAPAASEPAPAAEAESAAPRGFKRPSFLSKKS